MNSTCTGLKKMKLNRTKNWIDRLLLRVAYFARTWPPRDLCILVWTGLNSFSRDKQKVKSRRTDERRLDFGLETMRIQARSRLLLKILLLYGTRNFLPSIKLSNATYASSDEEASFKSKARPIGRLWMDNFQEVLNGGTSITLNASFFGFVTWNS